MKLCLQLITIKFADNEKKEFSYEEFKKLIKLKATVIKPVTVAFLYNNALKTPPA